MTEGLEEVGLYSTGEPFMTKNLDQFIKISKDLLKTSDDGVSFLTPIYTFGYAKTEDQSDNPIFDSALIPRGVNTYMTVSYTHLRAHETPEHRV